MGVNPDADGSELYRGDDPTLLTPPDGWREVRRSVPPEELAGVPAGIDYACYANTDAQQDVTIYKGDDGSWHVVHFDRDDHTIESADGQADAFRRAARLIVEIDAGEA